MFSYFYVNILINVIIIVGNLTAATSLEILRLNAITHVLTLDSVPLPQHVTEATFLTTKYVQSKCNASSKINFGAEIRVIIGFFEQLPIFLKKTFFTISMVALILL